MLYLGVTNALFLLRFTLSGAMGSAKRLYFPILLGLFLFSAYRWQVGCDWSGYYYQYLRASDLEWADITGDREPIWWAILRLMHDYDFAYPYANVISSAIFFIGVHVLAKRQPDRLAFLVLLFPILIINMPMSGIRQAAAIGLVCIAFGNFVDRRPLAYLFWVVIATGFHSSAAIFLPLVTIASGKYSAQRVIFGVLLSVPGVIALASGDAAKEAAEMYINTGIEAFGAAFRVGLIFISGLYYFIFLRKRWRRLYSKDYVLVEIGAFAMIASLALLPLSTVIADRFAYYLIPIQAVIFSRIPFLQLAKHAKMHFFFPYIFAGLTFFIWTQLSYHFRVCYIPYDNWLFGIPDGDILKYN